MTRSLIAQRFAEAAAERNGDLATLEVALSSDLAHQASSLLHVDLDRVRRGLPHLSDAELKDLAARAAVLKEDPASSGVSDSKLILLIIVIVLVVVLVVVVVDRHGDDGGDDDDD